MNGVREIAGAQYKMTLITWWSASALHLAEHEPDHCVLDQLMARK